MFAKNLQQQLVALARDAINHRLQTAGNLRINPRDWSTELTRPGACFVTLKVDGKLRGCIGSIEARRALVEDVCDNATGAAFHDPRFQPLSHSEFEQLELSISVLGEPAAIAFESSSQLARQLRPGIDGLILQAHKKRAVFLPQVWESLPNPADFILQLKRKAGIADTAEPPVLEAQRFEVQHFA